MTLAGTKVGHFRVEEPIGKGGMGEVYLGFNEALKKKVALKALRAGRRLSARTRARFLREARILSHLDHPNICRIHDYVEGDETDFLVLELIEGSSLPKAIEKGLEYAVKLRIAEQIANALIEAHAAGVVHRDLKPGNVMLTREDQVKVLDFGLARPVEVTTGEAAALSDPGEPAAAGMSDEITFDDESVDEHAPTVDRAEMSIMLETKVGSVVGTPAYMSPEQARGEPATWASDMYSFGLLLQTLFTEKPPYEENIPGFILLRKAVQAETLPVTGLHADLTHLIERLKSPAPSSRPTAVEATARLRRIRDKPKRRMRRLVATAAVVVLALAGVKYALDLRYERGVARQRQAQAETLIVYHLGDLRDQLEPLGRLDILDGVGSKALEYFQSVDESLLSTDELSRYAMALRQIGRVRIDLGDLEGALEAFRESLSRAESLVARDPLNGAWQKGLGEAHFYVGSVQLERGNIKGALERVRTYRRIAEGLVEREPDVEEWQLELAFSHSNTGSILKATGDLRRAIAEYDAALEIKQSLVHLKPDDLERRHSMTVTHEDLADVFQSLGRLDAAEDHYRRSVEIKRTLVNLEPDNVRWTRNLGVGLSRLGNLLSTKGDSEAALEQFRASLEISERLLARDPENASWRRGAAICHLQYGRELEEHDPAASLTHLDTARKLLSEIIVKDPTHTVWQRDLAVVDLRIAEALESRGELNRAQRSVSIARKALETLRDAQPDDRETARRLGTACLVQGRILEKQDHEGEARAAWQRALRIVEPVARDSDETEFLDVWTRILLRLDRLEEAEPIIRKLRSLEYSDDDLDELLRDKGVTT